MIVVWASRDDSPSQAVCRQLNTSGAEFLNLDRESIVELYLKEAFNPAGTLSSMRSMYLRCPVPPFSTPTEHAASQALLRLSERTPALVVNRPRDMAANDCKPWQAKLVREFGFATPDTVITTDPAVARDFIASRGRVIYKSISGHRSVVTELVPTDLKRISEISSCPTQFQDLICGTNYRVHVVDHEIFVARIETTHPDYRYAAADGGWTTMTADRLPEQISRSCLRMATSMQLHVAGIDLMLADNDDWYCFEVNPSPAFTWFESATGAPIAAAIAGLLKRGVNRGTAAAANPYQPVRRPTTERA